MKKLYILLTILSISIIILGCNLLPNRILPQIVSLNPESSKIDVVGTISNTIPEITIKAVESGNVDRTGPVLSQEPSTGLTISSYTVSYTFIDSLLQQNIPDYTVSNIARFIETGSSLSFNLEFYGQEQLNIMQTLATARSGIDYIPLNVTVTFRGSDSYANDWTSSFSFVANFGDIN